MRSYEQLLYACGLANVADSPWSRSPMNVSKGTLEGIGGGGVASVVGVRPVSDESGLP